MKLFRFSSIKKFVIFFTFCLISKASIKSMESLKSDKNPLNVFGDALKSCKEGTGFYRNGSCNTGEDDHGTHVVCAIVDDRFLEYTKRKGNDLSTPRLPYFAGLKNGDHWCLCGFRFEEARKAGYAPKIIPESTHIKALEFTPMHILKEYFVEKK